MKERTFHNDLCNGKISYYPGGDLKVSGVCCRW